MEYIKTFFQVRFKVIDYFGGISLRGRYRNAIAHLLEKSAQIGVSAQIVEILLFVVRIGHPQYGKIVLILPCERYFGV